MAIGGLIAKPLNFYFLEIKKAGYETL